MMKGSGVKVLGAMLALLAGTSALSGTSALAHSPSSHHHTSTQHDSASVADAAEESVHVVKAGETMDGIAYRAHIPRVLIEEANHLKHPYAVHTGQRLFLPRTRHHTVVMGETGFDIAMRYDMPFSAIAVANGLKPEAPLKAGQKLLIPTLIPHTADKGKPKGAEADRAEPESRTRKTLRDKKSAKDGLKNDKSAPKDEKSVSTRHRHAPDFTWPLDGKVVRGFTPRSKNNYHDGIDIRAPQGTAVRASADGDVIFAGEEPQDFGRLVLLDHRGGWQTAYGFLSRITVHKGEHVRAGERIGLVGHTGKAPRAELHFEIRKANKPVNPRDVLPDR